MPSERARRRSHGSNDSKRRSSSHCVTLWSPSDRRRSCGHHHSTSLVDPVVADVNPKQCEDDSAPLRRRPSKWFWADAGIPLEPPPATPMGRWLDVLSIPRASGQHRASTRYGWHAPATRFSMRAAFANARELAPPRLSSSPHEAPWRRRNRTTRRYELMLGQRSTSPPACGRQATDPVACQSLSS